MPSSIFSDGGLLDVYGRLFIGGGVDAWVEVVRVGETPAERTNVRLSIRNRFELWRELERSVLCLSVGGRVLLDQLATVRVRVVDTDDGQVLVDILSGVVHCRADGEDYPFGVAEDD